MKRLTLLVMATLVLGASATSEAQKLSRRNPRNLKEAVGWSLPLAPQPSPQSPFVPGTSTKQFGTVYFESDESTCPVSSVYPAWTTLFSKSFTTGLAQTAIELSFSGQVNIDTGTSFDGVYVRCQYQQGTGSFYTCPGIGAGPALVTVAGTTGPTYYGQSIVSSFHTVISGLTPDTSTTVEIAVTSLTSQGLFYSVCNSNLIVQQ